MILQLETIGWLLIMGIFAAACVLLAMALR